MRQFILLLRYYLFKNIFPALSLFLFFTNAEAQPQIAQASDVENCQYVGKVEGNSGYGKKNDWRNVVEYSVLNQAEQLNASHIVWEQFQAIGGFNGIAEAKAYQCQDKN